jgi:hypothetical protein
MPPLFLINLKFKKELKKKWSRRGPDDKEIRRVYMVLITALGSYEKSVLRGYPGLVDRGAE